MAAYNRGDYVPAIRLFRPLAEQGNAKAQSLIGVMYRRGQGVARNSVRAFLWFSRAAARGDAKAKAQLHDVSQAMTPQELSRRGKWRRPARPRTTGPANIDHRDGVVPRDPVSTAIPVATARIGNDDAGVSHNQDWLCRPA